MSYILEALQKSEHARHRGKVPDLNTLPETTPSATAHLTTRRPPYLAASFALALAAAVLGWWRPWQAAEPQPATTPPQATRNVQAEAARSVALAAPAAPQAVALQPAPPPAPPAVTAPAAPPALAALAPEPRPAAAPQAAKTAPPVPTTRRDPPASERPAPVARSTPPALSATRIATATPAASAPTRKASDGRILNIHELPPAVRGSLPRLDISGFAAAPDSDKRMVVINDRLVQEGEEVAPGLTLTSAGKDGVVLDFQGYRFRAQQ
ncbi:general secretion pathway protein GspB [Aromatoleum evansii]|uniref:general secretion pathway protein GspB n=1 Tax=Aromatoleum evansii TaxID=59406 RepID=UPI00145F83A5|nr:general secretion pathway protein GspB [Aromatoleum evansii]NMG30764.1 GspB domain-containing protein [Aromatoleum evansii]